MVYVLQVIWIKVNSLFLNSAILCPSPRDIRGPSQWVASAWQPAYIALDPSTKHLSTIKLEKKFNSIRKYKTYFQLYQRPLKPLMGWKKHDVTVSKPWGFSKIQGAFMARPPRTFARWWHHCRVITIFVHSVRPRMVISTSHELELGPSVLAPSQSLGRLRGINSQTIWKTLS